MHDGENWTEPQHADAPAESVNPATEASEHAQETDQPAEQADGSAVDEDATAQRFDGESRVVQFDGGSNE